MVPPPNASMKDVTIERTGTNQRPAKSGPQPKSPRADPVGSPASAYRGSALSLREDAFAYLLQPMQMRPCRRARPCRDAAPSSIHQRRRNKSSDRPIDQSTGAGRHDTPMNSGRRRGALGRGVRQRGVRVSSSFRVSLLFIISIFI
jgi:hypothetical protein